MPRKIVGYNDGITDFFACRQMLQKQGTVKLYFGKGFTPEEEDREVKRALRFYESLNDSGFHPRTQRLKIIHDDGSRTPYFVNLYGRGLTV